MDIDRSEVKYPTHNYYIMFDKVKGGGGFKENIKSMVLERKIERLEKEVKEIKGAGMKKSQPLRDSKMRMEKLINSLTG